MEQQKELAAFMAAFRDKFDPALAAYLSETILRMSTVDATAESVAMIIRDFSMKGGKRLRGALVAIGYGAFSNAGWERAIQAAISTELFHAFFLVHDDLMDRSDLRRGSPTVHRVFEKDLRGVGMHAHRNDVEHLANSMAMLAGDLCCAIAYDALLTLPFSAERILRALKHMQRTVDSTVSGQMLDMMAFGDPSEDIVTKIYTLKTARYSVEAPLHLGMILADAKQHDLDAMSHFAIPVGIAFQIKDDLLGIFGSEEEIGKPVTSDLEEGKETLLTVFVRKHGSTAQRALFTALHGQRGLSADDLEEVRTLFRACGAVEFCENRALTLVNEGKRALERVDIPTSSRTVLCELADYMVSRSI